MPAAPCSTSITISLPDLAESSGLTEFSRGLFFRQFRALDLADVWVLGRP
jgi:hypothetical protein